MPPRWENNRCQMHNATRCSEPNIRIGKLDLCDKRGQVNNFFAGVRNAIVTQANSLQTEITNSRSDLVEKSGMTENVRRYSIYETTTTRSEFINKDHRVPSEDFDISLIRAKAQKTASIACESVKNLFASRPNVVETETPRMVPEIETTVTYQEMVMFLYGNKELWNMFQGKLSESGAITDNAVREILRKFIYERKDSITLQVLQKKVQGRQNNIVNQDVFPSRNRNSRTRRSFFM